MPSCTYGTQRKSGTIDWLWIGGSAYLTWLGLTLNRIAGALLGFIVPNDIINADTLCASEVEVPSPPSTLEWVGAFLRNPIALATVTYYLRQSYLSAIWGDYCECSPSGSGTCYSLMPTGTYANTSSDVHNLQFGYEFYAKVSGLFCYGFAVRLASVGVGTFRARFADQTDVTIYEEDFAGIVGLHTYLFATPQALDHTGAGAVYDILLAFPNAGYTFTYENVNVTPNDTTQLHGNLFVSGSYPGAVSAWSAEHFPLDALICTAGGPSGDPVPYVPIEPVDPAEIPDYPEETCDSIEDLCARLTRMEAIMRFTDRSVSWLQSTLSPDSWLPGTTATGLTGSGSIAASDTLGLFVTATVPPSWGITYETPSRLIPAIGSIQWSVDGVPLDSLLVHYDEQHIFGAPAATDEVLYNFKPGVVGEITLLTRYR